MPQLQLSRFAGQFPRSSPGQSSGAVFLSGTRTAAAPEAQSVNRLGQTLERIGGDLVAIDLQFAQAKAQTLSVEASTTLAGEAQALQFQISTDPAIYPSDRAAAFLAQIEPRMEALGADVPELGRARYVAASSRAVQKAAQTLRIKGYEDSVERATQAYETEQARLQRKLLTARTEDERAEVIGDLRTSTQLMVTTGVFTPEGATARFQEFGHDTARLQLELLMETNPQAALAQLETGLRGNPMVRPDELPELIQQARQRWDSQLTRELTAETRENTRRKQQQDLRASEYRTEIYAPDVTATELSTLLSRANDDRVLRRLGEEDHAEFLKTIDTKLLKISTDAEEDEDADLASGLVIRLHGVGTPAALNEVEGDVKAAQSDLGFTTVSTLLGRVRQARESLAFTNRPKYREGVSIMVGISGAFSAGMLAVMVDRMSGERRFKIRTMLDQYRDEMERLVPQGVSVVDERAIPLARELRNTFFPPEGRATFPPVPTTLLDDKRPWQDRQRELNAMKLPDKTKDMLWELMEVDRSDKRKATAKKAADDAQAVLDSRWFYEKWFPAKESE